MFLTLGGTVGRLLDHWLLGSHCFFDDRHMGDVLLSCHVVLRHQPTQLHLFAERTVGKNKCERSGTAGL